MKKLFLIITSMIFLACCLHAKDKKNAVTPNTTDHLAKAKEVLYKWYQHGSLEILGGYDSNINKAPNANDLNDVKDGTITARGDYSAHKILPQRCLARFHVGGEANYYINKNSLNWNTVRFMSSIAHYFNNRLKGEITAHVYNHYQPQVLNDASELVNEHFTNNFSHFECAINPSLTYKFGGKSIAQLNGIFAKQVFKSVDNLTPYNNKRIFVNGIVRHNINDFFIHLIGTYEHLNYKNLPPYYGGVLGAQEQLANNERKKLRSMEGKCFLSYQFDHFIPTVSYEYKYQKDRFDGFDSYDSNKFGLMAAIPWGQQKEFHTTPKVSYERRDFKNRIVSTTDTSKVHYNLYNVSLNQDWVIDKEFSINGMAEYNRRATNVHSGRLNRKYSQFIAQVGLKYNF